jgi:predicted RNA binding protein YcfA (HicA-like mRNA interferase family)
MGRLAGFRYREIVKRLKQFGFEFDRQAAGSHELWFNPETRRYTHRHPESSRRHAGRNTPRHPQAGRHRAGDVPREVAADAPRAASSGPSLSGYPCKAGGEGFFLQAKFNSNLTRLIRS